LRDRWILFIGLVLIIISFAFAGDTLQGTGLTAVADRNSVIGDITKIVPSTSNIKIYDSLTNTATIKSPDGKDLYGTIKLLTPINMQVGAGYQKVAEFEINSKTTYTNFLKQMYFFDLKNNSQGIKRGFDLREKIDYSEEQPIYDYVCEVINDKNEVCEKYIEKDTGRTETIHKTRYDLLTEKNFEVETKIVSIWTNVEINDSIEWIPELYGTLIKEWASWDYSLNTGLVNYYKFNETGSVLIDSLNDNNGTNANTTQDISGIQNKAYSYNGGNASTTLNHVPVTSTGAWSYSFWTDVNGGGANTRFYWFGQQTDFKICTTQYSLSGVNEKKISFACWAGATITSDANINYNQWNHIVVTYGGATRDVNMYLNGSLVGSAYYDGAINIGTTYKEIMGDSGTNKTGGKLDEFAAWSRELTAAEVTSLYAGGAGMSYDVNETAASKARLTFNVYRAGTSTNLSGVNFDSNVSALNLANQTSPFSTIYQDQNTSADGNFSRAGYDSNKLSGQYFYFDTNKTYTIYLTDSTAPTIGATVVQDFNVYNGFIKGTGIVSALATDTGSDINATGCAYTTDGSNWTYGIDYNGTHCYKTGVSVSNATDYNFNFKAFDNAGNVATGTKASYRGDVAKPFTYLAITHPNGDNNALITMTCTDSPGSGCNYTKYNINNLGWNTYTNPFSYVGLGQNDINFYSVDNVGNIEDMNSIDYNESVILTIKYPKNIATLVQLTEKWTLRSTGGVVLNLTDLNSDYNVFVQPGILTTFYIADVNGNYTQNIYTKTYYADSNTGYDTLQPYLYAINTSLATTINIKSATTNQPIQDVTIKIYGNLPGIGNTLIGQGTSDSKGQILQLFIAGQAYTFDVYYAGNLIKTFNITATSTTIYILLDLGGIVISPTTQRVFTANWTPSPNLQKAYTGTISFTQTLNNINSDTISILSMLTQNGVYLDANQTYTGASNNTFTHTINWVSINTYPIISKMIVTASDGNVYTFTQTYQVNVSDSNTYGGTYNLLTGLQSGLRKDLSCEWNSATYYLTPCFPLFFIALIICIALVIGASIVLGQFSGQSAGLIFLTSMILFTFLTWIPVYVTAGLVLIMLAFIVNDRGGQ